MTEIHSIQTDCSFSFTNITLMRFLPHAHRISLLSPAPVSHIFHNCRPSMPRKQKAASVPTPIKQSHEAMVVSYRPQTLRDTIHTVLPGEVLPAIPSYLEPFRILFATYIPLRQRKMVSYILRRFFRYDPVPAPINQSDTIRWKRSRRHSPTRIHDLPDICPCYKIPVHDLPLFFHLLCSCSVPTLQGLQHASLPLLPQASGILLLKPHEASILLPDPMILLQIFHIRSQKDGSSYPVSSFYNSTPFVSITCLYQDAESFIFHVTLLLLCFKAASF